MPVTQNLRVFNVHNTSTGYPLLSCSFEGCGHRFQMKFALTKHQQTSHLLDSSPSCSSTSPPPNKPNKDRFFCSVPECLHLFKNKGALIQHSCLHHSSHPVPVTTPSSPIDSEPPTESHLSSS